MREYRYHLISRDGEHIQSQTIGARDDAHAIAQTELMQPGLRCQLWDGDRLVVDLPANGSD